MEDRIWLTHAVMMYCLFAELGPLEELRTPESALGHVAGPCEGNLSPTGKRFAFTRAWPQTNTVNLSYFSLTDSISSVTPERIFNTEKKHRCHGQKMKTLCLMLNVVQETVNLMAPKWIQAPERISLPKHWRK